MKPKYEIELVINNIMNKGYIEIYDEYMILYIENQSRTIMYKNIKENIIENDKLRLVLKDDTMLLIKTIKVNYIHEFIELQQNEDGNYPINFKTKRFYIIKFFIISFIVILFIILLLSGFNVDGFTFMVYVFWSLVFAIPATIYKNAHNDERDRASGICPYCKKQMIIQYNIGGVKSGMYENEVNTMNCGQCGNIIGIKYNHLYKLTSQNESQFNIKKSKDIPSINTINVDDDNISNNDDFNKLEKLKEMLDKRIITQEDFEKKKQDILNKL